MKNAVLSIPLFFFMICSYGQLSRVHIILNDTLTEKLRFEFSGLAYTNAAIYLIPSLKSDEQNPLALYKLNSDQLSKALDDSKKDPVHFNGYEVIPFDKPSFDKYIMNYNGKPVKYDGIEAGVIVHDSLIYFSIETDDEDCVCYIARGHFDSSKTGIRIIMDNSVAISKPAGYKEKSNVGFESLVFYDEKLWAVFEKEYKPNGLKVVSLDSNLKLDLEFYLNPPTYPHRLSDLTVKNNKLYGIFSKEGLGFSIRSIDLESKTVTMLDSSKDVNEPAWEGIAPFKKGFLLTMDNNNGKKGEPVPTELIYLTGKHF